MPRFSPKAPTLSGLLALTETGAEIVRDTDEEISLKNPESRGFCAITVTSALIMRHPRSATIWTHLESRIRLFAPLNEGSSSGK